MILELVTAPTVELNFRGSRFLSEAFSVSDSESAREILRSQKQLYSDSTHVVHAFVIGIDASVLGCSDDGEPPGTAGRPMLEVLRNGLVRNIMVTVTRWFGGTKLGTGGLVKAYTESCQAVLEKAVTRELLARKNISFTVPYQFYDAVKKLLEEIEFIADKEEFTEDIFLAGEIPDREFEAFAKRLKDLTLGKVIL